VNLRDKAEAWREMRRGNPVRPKPESAALIAAVDALPPREGTEHRYLSTGCLHGEHDYCAGKTRQDGGEKVPAKCKFCDARCVCGCHAPSRREGACCQAAYDSDGHAHDHPLPRQWSLPPEPPEDVTRVRDADGIEWERREPGDWRRVGIDHARPYAFGVLVSRFGPLTEVVDSNE
jgi:hypothetical protein